MKLSLVAVAARAACYVRRSPQWVFGGPQRWGWDMAPLEYPVPLARHFRFRAP